MFVPIPGELVILFLVVVIGGFLLYWGAIIIGVIVLLILSPWKEHFPSLYGDYRKTKK